MRKILLSYCTVFSILTFACSPKVDTTNENLDEAGNQSFTVDTLSTGIENPWGMTFISSNRILITDKSGEIRIIQDGQLSDEKIEGVPEVAYQGQGGLLDIKTHPDFENNGLIYITYSKPGPGGNATALARAKLDGNTLTDLSDIFVGEYINSTHHFGSRIAFDNEGYLFVSTGERGTKPNSQDLSNCYGKIHRIYDDGRVPSDNPFVEEDGVVPTIWSYGHRNVQGMVFDQDSEILWAHEHGPRGGDEINIVEKGKNYGWPLVTYGIDYDGTVISEETEKEGIQNPVHFWDPSIAPCGMTIVKGDTFKYWEGNLLVGALAHRHLARVVVANNIYKDEEKLLEGVGRVRVVQQGPDGNIYLGTEGPGLILKITP